MVIPDLFDVIDVDLLYKWRNEIEKDDRSGNIKLMKEAKDAMVGFNGEQKDLVDKYTLAIENSLDIIYYEICKRLFKFGFKSGMDMQKFIDGDKIGG